jgi:transcription termination/antitermination protein NusG
LGSNDLNRQWYALQVRPRFEKLAARHLSMKGYEEYLPLCTSRRSWSDRTKTLQLPLLPGYTFCKFNVQDSLRILVIPGVLSIVGIGKLPIAISDAEILGIQTVIASGLQYGPWPYALPGQRVRVERGALAGLEGAVIRVQSDLRLIVSLPLLQRSVFVRIDRECIEALSGVSQSCRTTSVSNSVLTISSPL